MYKDDHPLYYIRLLVVDDDKAFVKEFRKIVRKFGHVMKSTRDPDEAACLINEAYVKLDPFDVAFVGCHTPTLNSEEAALKLLEADPQMSIVAITSSDLSPEKEKELKDSGVFVLLMPENISLPRLDELFDMLVFIARHEFSGFESRIRKKQRYDKMRAQVERLRDTGVKNTAPETAAKKTTEKVTSKTAAKKAAKKAAGKSVKKTVKKTMQRRAGTTVKKAAGKTAKKAVKKTEETTEQ